MANSKASNYPLPLEGEIYYCGFNSPKSYGGRSYFIRHPQGNWLIDSPKFLPLLVDYFRQMGGIKHLFLTHKDDVADAGEYAKVFRSCRIIHRDEASAQPDAEKILDGVEPIDILPEFKIIPTPGHTKGHCVLHYKDRFLFTGDHLCWDSKKKELHPMNRCWYSRNEQIKSMKRLIDVKFEWVLPGHGQRVKLPSAVMKQHLKQLVVRMESLPHPP
jgi:glyoxylase-like metal-dependent hydrolase (beta-lactamase superfamily II)